MATTTLTAPGGLEITTTEGDRSSMGFAPTGDLVLRNPKRGRGGRALVPVGDGVLEINYGGDFSVVLISGAVSMPGLQEPPPGVETDRVLIGKDGKLYRAD